MIILPSLEIVPAKYNGSTLLSQIPIDGTGDFTVTRATSPTTGQSTRVNALGQIELVADNVPRLDYPIGGGCPALLVEPAATNSIRNNSMVGAVTGSPGTLPTHYETSLAGLTRTIVGTGTENGVAYMDIRFNGTSTGGAVILLEETSFSITAASGQVWTHSVYAKLIANVLNMPSIRVGMYEYTSGGVYLTEGSTIFTLTSSLNRFSFTRTLANASTARVIPIVQWLVNNGVSYDFTIRIGYPQMELGSVATSVIPTTTQAITRAADVITDTTASGVIGQVEGTVYCEFVNSLVASYAEGYVYRVFADANNEIWARKEGGGNTYSFRWRANSANTTFSNVAVPNGVSKIAFGYKSGDTALFLNGSQVATTNTDVRAFSVNPTTIALGSTSSGQFFNDRIRAATLYPTRLTNTQLALLTSPYTSYSSMASALSYTLG